MLSTTTIIYIVIAIVILFFIYNSMKKCEGYTGTPAMTTYSSKKNIDITKQVSEIERKLRVVDPLINVKVEVYGGIPKKRYPIDPNFRLTFTSSSDRVKMLDVMTDQKSHSLSGKTQYYYVPNGKLRLKDANKNQVGDLIDISEDLNAIKNNNKPERITFTMVLVKGGFDTLNIIVN
jgi:hypothetical protein